MKVVIIGGGPAGLTAAYKLLKTNKKNEVIVLEAEDTLGGIAKTVFHNGNRMDIGGHRFFSKSKEITDLWEELMPIQGKPSYDDKVLHRTSILSKDGPDPEGENIVMLNRNRVSRIYYLNKFFDYPISMKMATFRNLGFVRTMKSGLSYLKSMVIKKKEDSLENFYINRFGKTLYSMFFEKYTEKVWGRHPSEISADWGAQRVKGLSILVILKNMFVKSNETSLIESFWYPKYGQGQLWEELARQVEEKGAKIQKG